MLDNLQGNVLKPHGRKESDHLVLRFTGDPAAVRAWIRGFARDEVTSARTQIEAATAFRGRGAPGGMFVNLYVSATGYASIGIDTGAVGPAGASSSRTTSTGSGRTGWTDGTRPLPWASSSSTTRTRTSRTAWAATSSSASSGRTSRDSTPR